MEDFKVNIDREDISSSRINAHKDFDKLFSKFTKINGSSSIVSKSLLKSAKLWIATSLSVLAIASVVYFYTHDSHNKKIDNQVVVSDSVITDLNSEFKIIPPIDSLDISFQEYLISSSRDTTIVTESGTKIFIPKNAFRYSDGTAVEGELKIRFREFNTPIDFFLSGIPMEYDSANTRYTFESAGMIEIRAYKLGKELQLCNNKQISINMLSKAQETNYNVYNLNDTIGSWTYNGKDEVYKSIDKVNISKNYSNLDSSRIVSEMNNVSYVELIEPKLLNENKYVFNYKIDGGEFPELAQYSNVLFEIDESKCNFKESMFSVVWENKKLNRSNLKGEYLLNLSKGDTGVQLVIYPVFEPKYYYDAIEKYNRQKKIIERARKQREQANNTKMNVASSQSAVSLLYNRRYNIFQMGIHNIDRPIINPMIAIKKNIDKKVLNAMDIESISYGSKGKEISLIIMDKEGIPLNYEEINAVDLSRNALYRFPTNSNLKVHENAKIVVWVVTSKGDIAIVNPNLFKEKVKNGNSIAIKSSLHSVENGVIALRNFLNDTY